MKYEEVFAFYDEHWNDYNKVMDMLHDLMDAHQEEVQALEKRLMESYLTDSSSSKDESHLVKELKTLLLECQDKLDEETHKL